MAEADSIHIFHVWWLFVKVEPAIERQRAIERPRVNATIRDGFMHATDSPDRRLSRTIWGFLPGGLGFEVTHPIELVPQDSLGGWR